MVLFRVLNGPAWPERYGTEAVLLDPRVDGLRKRWGSHPVEKVAEALNIRDVVQESNRLHQSFCVKVRKQLGQDRRHVVQPGTLPLPADGRISDPAQLGNLVCRYQYDGLGRLICKETPVQGSGYTYLQRKDLYYDGVRRIQEVIYRPDLIPPPVGGELMVGAGGEANDEQPVLTTQPTTQPSEEPEQVILAPPPGPQAHWTDREYVWGPEYVDELICQIPPLSGEHAGPVMYALLDGNYNVVGLTNWFGQMLEQYAYEPYGNAAASESFGPHAVNRVGHQGLFFERFDGSYTEPSIAANIAGLYYNRNRFYSPTLGRFITRDPNETGMPILTALAMNGETASVMLRSFDGRTLYGDSMNSYAYVASNPVSRIDPSGLENLLSVLAANTAIAAIATAYESPWLLAKSNTPGQLIRTLAGSFLANLASQFGGPWFAIAANIMKSLGVAWTTQGEIDAESIVRAAVTAVVGGVLRSGANGIGNKYNISDDQVRWWATALTSFVNNVTYTSAAFFKMWMDWPK